MVSAKEENEQGFQSYLNFLRTDEERKKDIENEAKRIVNNKILNMTWTTVVCIAAFMWITKY